MPGEPAPKLRTDRSGPLGFVRAGVTYLADLIQAMVSKLATLGTAVLAFGGAACEDTAKVAPPPPAVVVPTPVEAEPKPPGPIGEFDITFYYVTSEEEIAAKIAKEAKEAANENAALAAAEGVDLASVIPPEPPPREIVPLYDRTCNVLAEVDKEFFKSLAMQGTGRLKDGRLLNVVGRNNCDCERKPCFHVIEGQVWGKAGTGRPLAPFRTVAVDPKIIKLNSLLYVPLLEGRTMPGRPPWGGFVHDGCLVADDTGGAIKGFQLDLFVGRKGNFLGLSGSGGSHAWARHVQVFDGASRCERKGRRIGRKSGAI